MSASLTHDPLGSPIQTQITSLTEVDHQHPGANGSTTSVTPNLLPASPFQTTITGLKGSSYHDLFPASHRTKKDEVGPFEISTSFFKKEFDIERLHKIHRWLVLVGRPMPPRPLHYQKAVKRDIIVHEQFDLHLAWDNKRMFLKPIPGYLFSPTFWDENLSCQEQCAAAQGSTQGASGTETGEEVPLCDRCEIYKCALGFMISYASLITYESDLHIAKDAHLVPNALDWPTWRRLVKELLTPANKRNINKRYTYGELRLTRLNEIYRCTLKSPIRGYIYGYNTYNQFWHDNYARIVSLFAFIALVLTAMQVGLATTRLSHNEAFQRASYGFTVFSIVFPSACICLALGTLFILVVYNAIATLVYHMTKGLTKKPTMKPTKRPAATQSSLAGSPV